MWGNGDGTYLGFFKKGICYGIRRGLYGPNASSKTYISYLRKKGAEIGEGTHFFNPRSVTITTNEAYLLTIGKNCQITGGVSILTHDYGWSVTKAVYGDVLGSIREVVIGDNVYIGMNATIIAGVHIGNNVVIGANSLVSNDIPDNCVAVGNPCRVIYSLEEYHKRRKEAQLEEAVMFIKAYYKRYDCKPPISIMREHFWLFANKKEDLPELFINQNNLISGSEERTWQNFESHIPMFPGYDAFVEYARNF